MGSTIRDVAEKAGVSAMTVSRVINKQSGVSAKTRNRIEQALRELDYSPNRGPARQTRPGSQLIGMIVPDLSNPFFAPLVRGAEQTASKAGYRMLICNSESDLRLERDYVDDLVTHDIAGLIIAPVSDRSKEHLDRLKQSGVPIVLLDRTIADFESDSVTVENKESAERITEHLIKIGHSKIVFVSDSMDVSSGRERRFGFDKAMHTAGIEVHENMIVTTTADIVGGQRAAQELLALDPRPTAIVAVNNMTALGIMASFRELGIRVPQDIALVCFDDVQHLAIISPVLTVIDQPADTMASVAAQMLVERMNGKAGKASRTVRFPAKLIVRESCGAILASAKKT
jgi:LacI family transcriptional regulator